MTGTGEQGRWLDPAWAQMALNALRETLDVDAAMKWDMIDFLLAEGFWNPESLSREAAKTRFNACLNPSKPDFFKISEVWALSKRFHRHAYALSMIEDIGFHRPTLRPTEERRLELLERLVLSMERLCVDRDAIAAAVQQFGGDAKPLRIIPAIREGRVQFSSSLGDGLNF